MGLMTAMATVELTEMTESVVAGLLVPLAKACYSHWLISSFHRGTEACVGENPSWGWI